MKPIYARALLALLCLAAAGRVARSAGQTDVIDVKQYGAKGDGTTDDTAAFGAAIRAATSGGAPRASNSGAKIYVPCGKYILTAKLVFPLSTNAALGVFGATQSCTELQWNVGNGGLDFEYPKQATESPSRNPASAPGVAVDIEHLSLVDNAPGNSFTGNAILLRQPIPGNSIGSANPDATISDVAWYSLSPGQGGARAQGQAWLRGIKVEDVSNVHIDHVTGRQWGTQTRWGPAASSGIDIVSDGGPRDYFEQQIFMTNIYVQGAYDGIKLEGHSIQGVYLSNYFLLQNAESIAWLAPSEDASASFLAVNGSINGFYAGIDMAFVKQVMIANTEILGGAPVPRVGKLQQNYYGIRLNVTDDAMIHDNVLISPCSAACRGPSAFASGSIGTAIQILHHGEEDNQGSDIHDNSIAYGDVGISAGGSQILVHDNQIARAVAAPTQDVSRGPTRPLFVNNEVGRKMVSSKLPAPVRD